MRDLTSVPSPHTDDANVTLADWAGMSALLKPDGIVSREDLARALSRAHSVTGTTGRDRANDAFNELEDRGRACVPAQPTAAAAATNKERMPSKRRRNMVNNSFSCSQVQGLVLDSVQTHPEHSLCSELCVRQNLSIFCILRDYGGRDFPAA